MTREKLERGTIVLTNDPHTSGKGRRPYMIISDSSYPFFPNGHLGIPMTRKNKENTFELTDDDIEKQWEEFEKDANFLNPYSPAQVNSWGRKLCKVDESFANLLVRHAIESARSA
jgi:hypothetical protein